MQVPDTGLMPMEETMRTKIDYAGCSETLKKYLGLNGSPVAIKLATSKDQIPEGVPEIDAQAKHCMMVNLSRREGKIFYATAEKHQCMGGAWALGLREMTDTLKTGEFYFKLGKYESWAASKRTMNLIPHVKSKETYATIYSPLEKTSFSPNVVLIVANPRSILKLAQSSLFLLGGRIYPSFSGIQSVCSDATAHSYLSGKPNFSLGCDGSRRYSGILEDEMVMGMPAELLPEITDAIRVVTGAPGSV